MDFTEFVHANLNTQLPRRTAKVDLLNQFFQFLQSHTHLTSKDIKNIDALDTITSGTPHPDPLDKEIEAAGCPAAIIVRTDFSDEVGWNKCLESMRQAEADLLNDLNRTNKEDEVMEVDNPQNNNNEENNSDSSSSSENGDAPTTIIHILSTGPSNPDNLITNATNLTLLRLIASPSLTHSPPLPPSSPLKNNRLTSFRGIREVYKNSPVLWVYDSKSNKDGCLRAVGTGTTSGEIATGDSWRAKCTHVPELSWNTVVYGLTIDFGGVDGWEMGERSKNFDGI